MKKKTGTELCYEDLKRIDVLCCAVLLYCLRSTYLCAHGQSQGKHEDRDADGEDPPVLQKGLRPVVHNPGDQGLHVAELGVNTQDLEYEYIVELVIFCSPFLIAIAVRTYKQHDEEDDGPHYRAWEVENQIRVREEDQAGPGVDDVVDRRFLDVGHVAKD